MSRAPMYALVLPVLVVESWVKFAAYDMRWTTVFCLLALGVIAIWYAFGPQSADEESCTPLSHLERQWRQRGRVESQGPGTGGSAASPRS
jgi:hypothetical protein